MNEKIKLFALRKGSIGDHLWLDGSDPDEEAAVEKFVELIIQECLNKIETYKIPCGNSPSGELACEYTYDALESIRDDIKEDFGVE